MRGLLHAGKPYDFDFDFRRSDRLVCTEVIYRSFEGLGDVRLPLVLRAGRPTLSGSDLIEMTIDGTSFDPVLAYAPSFQEEVVTGKPAMHVLKRGAENRQ